jgi:hypothetical protein
MPATMSRIFIALEESPSEVLRKTTIARARVPRMIHSMSTIAA